MKLNTQRGGFGRPFTTMAVIAAAITTVTLESRAGASSQTIDSLLREYTQVRSKAQPAAPASSRCQTPIQREAPAGQGGWVSFMECGKACCQTAAPRTTAIMSSPRFQEEFPWLAAREVSRTESIQKAAAAERALAKLASNHALAASPRFIEEYPQMARANAELERSLSPEYLPAAVRRNSALAASPRVIEEFPWLAHGG